MTMHYFPMTDIVVIGTDPERADMDNPRGHIHGFAAYVVAEDERGNRCRLHVKTAYREADALAPAHRMADALAARLRDGKLPVAFDAWEYASPAYGSDAYIEYGQAEELAWERRMEEDE